MTIWDIFSEAVTEHPDNIGVVQGGESYTYNELDLRIQSLGSFFRSHGLRAGDRISILDYNSISFYEAYFAAAGIGAILNPLNYRLSVKELSFIINDAGSRWLIVNSDFCQQLIALSQSETCLKGIIWVNGNPNIETHAETFDYNEIIKLKATLVPAIVNQEDNAHLYYTSGTTGKSRGVILTHNNVCVHARGTVRELE